MATLKTNYKDDILDTSVNTQRKYRMVNNADGTISLEDVTVYTQNGDSFGAADINKTNQAVLDLNSSLGTWEDVSIGTPSSGNLVDGSIARINRMLKLGYFFIQVIGNTDNTTIKLGMTKEGSIGLPFYGYNDHDNKQCDCIMYEDTIYIIKANTTVKTFLLFPVSI